MGGGGGGGGGSPVLEVVRVEAAVHGASPSGRVGRQRPQPAVRRTTTLPVPLAAAAVASPGAMERRRLPWMEWRAQAASHPAVVSSPAQLTAALPN
eukprot:COSAG01_NODE_1938_length_8848_cov_17.798377_12_plen_96_part_00